jgi:hypothetical protein
MDFYDKVNRLLDEKTYLVDEKALDALDSDILKFIEGLRYKLNDT